MKKSIIILACFFLFSISKSEENQFYTDFLKISIPSILISFSLDETVKDFVRKNRGETLDDFTSFFNQFGSTLAAGTPFLIYGYSKYAKNRRLEILSRRAFFASLIAVSTVLPIKAITGRERPDKSDKMSFPSGHTALSFAVFGTYAESFNDYRRYILYSIPIFVGFSRIYKNHHYFSDVVTGGFLGYLSVYLSKKIDKYLLNKIKAVPYISVCSKNIGIKFKYTF